MKPKNKNTHSYTIDQIVDLKNAGTEISDVFLMYPENKQEIKDIYAMLTVFKNAKENSIPTKENLRNILEKLDTDKTTSSIKSPYVNIKNSYFFQWKIMAPVFVALLVVGFINYNPQSEGNSNLAVTENIDEIMQTIENDTQTENTLWNGDFSDNTELASFTADNEISSALTGDLLYENTL